MLVYALEIKNFKSIEELRMKIAPITVLVGPNNSGKSSILQALTLLKQSAGHRQLQLQAPLLNIGTYSDLAHNHEDDRNIEILISGSFRVRNLDFPVRFGYKFSEDAIVRALGNLEIPRDLQVSRGHGVFEAVFAWDHRIGEKKTIVKAVVDGVDVSLNGTDKIANLSLSVSSFPQGKEEVSRALAASFEPINKALRNVLRNIVMVPALRGQDKISLNLTERAAQDILDVQGHGSQSVNTVSMLAFRTEIEDKVSNWFVKVTGSKVRVRLADGPRITLEATVNDFRTNIINEGFGPNQLAYLLIPLASAPTYSTIGIEEPEVHLHPSSQVKLAEIFVEEAISQHKNLMITTHSDYFVTALLTMVAEKKLRRDELAIYSFESIRGRAQVTALEIDEKGRIQGGLPSFFGANVEQFKRYSDALEGTK